MTDIVPPQARKASAISTPSGLVPPYFEYPPDDGIDLVEYARRLAQQWRFMAAIVAATTVLATITAFTATPVYRAEVLLAPVSSSKGEGIASLFGQLGDLASLVETYVGSGKDRTAESIATLKSRALAIGFINERNLKPVLFPDRWDPVDQRWRGPRGAPTDLEAYDVFDNDVRRVITDRRSGLVTLAVEWSDPVLAAAWANALAQQVNARRRAEAIEEARTSIAYLQQQLAKNGTVEIKQALYRLIEAQTKTIAVASTREEYAFRVVDPAVTPEKRVRPRRLLLVAAGFCIGVLLAVSLAACRHAIRRRGTESGRGAEKPIVQAIR